MSLTKYNVEIDTEADKIEKPASRWRNLYKALVAIDFDNGKSVVPGELYKGLLLHPSKDVAESMAVKYALDRRYSIARGEAIYVGAFPEGQDADH